MAVTLEKVTYAGWPNCYRLANGIVEAIVTTDVGPRVIRFGLIGGENELKEYPEQVGQVDGREWKLYGGHRFWHAPEAKPRTYFPDNFPVTWKAIEKGIHLIQSVESTTGLQKELEITLTEGEAHLQIKHRLRNHGLWAIELAPWAITIMAPGGVAILPLPPRASHSANVLPTHSLAFWAYTNLADPRWTWGERTVLLQQAPRPPQKIGMLNQEGWIAYARSGRLFLKEFEVSPGAAYPDFGSTIEVFTDEDMLELETLGPLTKLEPEATVEHWESWKILEKIPEPRGEADVDQVIRPRVQAVRGRTVS